MAVPGGTTAIEITGGRGSGLRTARLLAARIARLAGFVPVASAVLVRLPWLRERLAGRHVCILLDDHVPDERTTLGDVPIPNGHRERTAPRAAPFHAN